MPAGSTRTTSRGRTRRAEGFAVRRWLQFGAASAGMGAALWGLSIAGPQVGVAAADTGGESSASSNASGSDGSRSVRSVRTVRSASDPRRAERSADKDDEQDTAKADADDAGILDEAPSAALTETVNTTAAQSISNTATIAAPMPSPTRSWQSPYQRWVARSLDAWTTDSLAWIDSLAVSDRTKGQLEASFFTTRRTFFNQAPTIDPIQISGVITGPVTGTVSAYDPDGDRLIYVLTRGPKSGTVHINRDGTYTYTPGDDFDGVDAFRVTAIDIGLHTNLLEPFRPVGSNPVRSLINQGAVQFDFDYTEGAEYWTTERRQALQNSADQLILYFRVMKPVVLVYTVKGQDNPDSSTLASAGSSLVSSDPGFWSTVVQQKLLTGVDANGSAADGRITWNFGKGWALGEEVGPNEFDFTSTAMHELLHSFGFLSMTGEAGENGNEYWTILDSFLVTGGGDRPINRSFEWDTDDDGYLTGGLFLDGANAVAAYGWRVPIYTPDPWEEGSSGSHLDDAIFIGAAEKMMNAKADRGPGVRVLSAIEIGILRDIGYRVVPPLAPVSALAFASFIFFVRRPRKSKSADA